MSLRLAPRFPSLVQRGVSLAVVATVALVVVSPLTAQTARPASSTRAGASAKPTATSRAARPALSPAEVEKLFGYLASRGEGPHADSVPTQIARDVGVTAMPRLVALLADPDPANRGGAALALGFMGAPAEAHLPKVASLLDDKRWSVRQDAAKALGLFGPSARQYVPRLITYMRTQSVSGYDPDGVASDTMPGQGGRTNAFRSLGQIGGVEARAATPDLIAALQDKMTADGGIAVVPGVLARVGAAKDVVPALTAALQYMLIPGKEWRARHSVIALGYVGAPAVPELVRIAATDPAAVVRANAVGALGGMAPAVGVPALMQVLEHAACAPADMCAEVRWTALYELKEYGSAASAAAPVVTKFFDSDSPRLVEMARSALQAIRK